MAIRIAVFALSAIVLTGCHYPTQTVTQGGVASAISLAALPAEAMVSVDGAAPVRAGDYGSAKVLSVTTGTHKVRVELGGQVLVEREVYVGRDSTVKVETR